MKTCEPIASAQIRSSAERSLAQATIDRTLYWAEYIADRLPPIQGAALRRYAQQQVTAKA